MKKNSVYKAVRHNCIECSGGSLKAVTNCHIISCYLWEYRFGKNPSRKGIGCVKNLRSNEND